MGTMAISNPTEADTLVVLACTSTRAQDGLLKI